MPKHTEEIGGYWEAVWGSVAGSVVYYILAQISYFTCEAFVKSVSGYSIGEISIKIFFAIDNILWLAILFFIFLAFTVVFLALYFLVRAIGCRCALAWGNLPGAKLTSKYLLRFDLFFLLPSILFVILLIIQSLIGVKDVEHFLQAYYVMVYLLVWVFVPPFLARFWSNSKMRRLKVLI